MSSELRTPELHLYEEVADKITKLIDTGTLRPGDRIPSVRKLSSQQGVSISTVLQTYYLLEDRGVVEARPQFAVWLLCSPTVSRLSAGTEDLQSPAFRKSSRCVRSCA